MYLDPNILRVSTAHRSSISREVGMGSTQQISGDTIMPMNANPPIHTLLTFTIAMVLCVWSLPSLRSVDEYATIETFTTSIFKTGPFYLAPISLGCIRLSFAVICVVVTTAKIKKGCEFKIVRLSGSKLRGGIVEMKGWKTQGFYTSWAWNLLGVSFFLSGTIPIFVASGRDDILINHPWILRAALISFEIAAPSAFLTTFIVTYALWPQAYNTHGASGTVGFKGWINLLQHDGNSAMVLLEITLMGGMPVVLSHAALAPLFAGVYQIFLWSMVNRWSPRHGPVFPYFFMDTTLGTRTTLFMLALLATIGCFFAVFALLDRGMALIEHGDYGVIPNLCCIICASYLLMKFKD
jgi:hypothetical protein